jgi:hypothetical protein
VLEFGSAAPDATVQKPELLSYHSTVCHLDVSKVKPMNSEWLSLLDTYNAVYLFSLITSNDVKMRADSASNSSNL